MMFLVPLGLFAGALTTVAGLGGGQLLVLALAAIWGPKVALVVSGPALLAGNLHRLSMYRRHVDWRIALTFAAGALPGSIAGGVLAVGLPAWLIHALLVTMTALAIARSLGWITLRPRPAALAPTGFGIGAVCAASSGAGLLVAPVLMATGLAGWAYVATSSFIAASLHLGRIGGYALGGLFTSEALVRSALLGVAILAGNLLGDRGRRRLPAQAGPWIERGTLAACVLLAVLGAA